MIQFVLFFQNFQSNNWFKSKLFCNKSCDNEAKQRLKISQKEELDRERKEKFEKHVNELVLLMRCKNNQLCNEAKPCDSCDRMIKSFKHDLDTKYSRKLGNRKNDGLINNENEESCLQKSIDSPKRSTSQAIDSSSQGLRITRLRKKGLCKVI